MTYFDLKPFMEINSFNAAIRQKLLHLQPLLEYAQCKMHNVTWCFVFNW